MALVLAPWAVYVVLLSSKQRWKKLAENRLMRFSMVFVGINCLVYWLSPATVPRYLFMFVPFSMAILAYGYHCFSAVSPRRMFVIELLWAATIIGLAIASLAMPIYGGMVSGPLVTSPGTWLIGIVLCLVFAAIFWAYRTRSELRPWLAVSAIVILRIGFDLVALPAKQVANEDTKPFKSVLADVLTHSAGEPVFVQTRRHYITVYLRVPLIGQIGGPITGTWDELIPYQISYHYGDRDRSNSARRQFTDRGAAVFRKPRCRQRQGHPETARIPGGWADFRPVPLPELGPIAVSTF